ncbi:MAG: tyrosine-type recombinase/integrase [Myxococcales bacterium]|nr:tyrosine-type recombinase/integrase [Myxococcales bacterium]
MSNPLTNHARVLAQAIAREMAQQTLTPKSQATLRHALAEVDRLVLQQQGRFAVKYVRMCREAIAKACEVIGDVPICDLGPEHALTLWNHYSPRSLTAYGSAIKARLGNAEELGFAGAAEFRDLLPTPPDPRLRPVLVTDEQHRQALAAIRWAAIHTRTWLITVRFLEIGLRCPFRLTELARLTVPEVDFTRSRAQLADSKTGPRWVPLTRRSCELLREQIESLPFGERRVWTRENGAVLNPASMSHAWARVRRQFAEITRNTELADVRYHDLRHFTCTQALEHGAPERHVQVALGHSAKTMERYQHCQFRGAVKAVQQVEDVLDDAAVADVAAVAAVADVAVAEASSDQGGRRPQRPRKTASGPRTRWPKTHGRGGRRSG